MKDVLPALERWVAEGLRVAVATVVERQGSAPRDPGASLAVNERGELAGSVTGGCVEPAVIREANEVLAGGPARVCRYGIADADAFEVGLSCGGTVGIAVYPLDASLVAPLAEAVAADRPVALTLRLDEEAIGAQRLVYGDSTEPEEATVRELLAVDETTTVTAGADRLLFVESFAPRPAMYVFGAVDHAAALVTIGKFLGYRVTVCDARRAFVTPERFPDADEIAVEWPDRFLETAPVDARTAICVLTHDQKFDVPVLQAALRTPARYIGAMGSRKTTEERAQRLREDGATDEEIARIHAPIGVPIGARSPEEVAVAVAAQLIAAASASRARGAAQLTVQPAG